MSQTSFILSPKDAGQSRRWHLLDARKQSLGRMATQAAIWLRGKHKPVYTDHVDCGDFVVVTNAAELKLTGHKIDQKFYFRHSGYAGGAKTIPVKRQMEKDPRKVVFLAVKRMLPGNRLSSRQLTRLKIYPGANHPHIVPTGDKKA